MAPLLRSRRTSPRLLAACPTTAKRYSPIDYRTKKHFAVKESRKAAKPGKTT